MLGLRHRSQGGRQDHVGGHHRGFCPGVPNEVGHEPRVPQGVPLRDPVVHHLREPAAIQGCSGDGGASEGGDDGGGSPCGPEEGKGEPLS